MSLVVLIIMYRYDYFIVSQSVRQGTVTPTHFNVICDSTGLMPDHMQRLTYKLCHLYYNWPVRIVSSWDVASDLHIYSFRGLCEFLLLASMLTNLPSWLGSPFTQLPVNT